MHTVQVVALPPNQGRMNFASIGWTWNRRKPARPIVAEKRRMMPNLVRMRCFPRSIERAFEKYLAAYSRSWKQECVTFTSFRLARIAVRALQDGLRASVGTSRPHTEYRALRATADSETGEECRPKKMPSRPIWPGSFPATMIG